MDRSTIESEILDLNEEFYFHDLINGNKFLCEDHMDIGLDLQHDGVYLYSEPEVLIKYDDPTLIDQVKEYLKIN